MLKSGKNDDIAKYFKRLNGEADGIVKGVVSLVYFMRGAVGYEEMMRRTYAERQIISDFIEKHLEGQKKSPYPVY